MRNLPSIAFMLLLIAVVIGAAPVAAQQQGYTCYRGQLTYTNNTTQDQTVYVTLYQSWSGKIIGESQPVAFLRPNQTFNGTVEAAAPIENDYDFIYSTQKLTQATAGNRFAASIIETCSIFTDGRLNYRDAAAPIVVYNENNTAFSIYGVNPSNGVGTELFEVPVTAIRPVIERAVKNTENLVITEAAGVTVYALSTGTCQVNAWNPDGKLYEFEWYCNI